MANNETVANVHDDMLQVVAGYVAKAQSDFVGYTERFAAAHKREMDGLRALVKELADALGTINAKIEFDPYIGGRWTIGDEEFESLHTYSLVDKAREVCK